MKKVFLIFFILPFSISAAEKSFCVDSDLGLNEKVRGKITIRLPKTNVLSSDRDYCKDQKTLVEFYCDKNNEQQKKEIKCNCIKGACK